MEESDEQTRSPFISERLWSFLLFTDGVSQDFPHQTHPRKEDQAESPNATVHPPNDWRSSHPKPNAPSLETQEVEHLNNIRILQ